MSGHEDSPIDTHHTRQHLAILRKAVVEGWDVPHEWKKSLPAVAQGIANNPDASNRDRIAALKVLHAIDSENAKKLELLDKMTRLDGDGPTEINEVRVNFVRPEDRE